jgi:hypothetical protein
VQQDDRRAAPRSGVDVTHVEHAGVDLAHCPDNDSVEVVTDISRSYRDARGCGHRFEDHVDHGLRLRDHDHVRTVDLGDRRAGAFRHRTGDVGAGRDSLIEKLRLQPRLPGAALIDQQLRVRTRVRRVLSVFARRLRPRLPAVSAGSARCAR